MGIAGINYAWVAGQGNKHYNTSRRQLDSPDTTQYVYRINIERIVKKDNFDYEKLSNKNQIQTLEILVENKDALQDKSMLIKSLEQLVQALKEDKS